MLSPHEDLWTPDPSSHSGDDDDHTDDELPRSSSTQLHLPFDPDIDICDDGDDDDNDDDDDFVRGGGDGDDDDLAAAAARRLRTHARLRAYEAKRRLAYESKLQSSSLYWRAFRALMHDSLLETQRADLLTRGWTHASGGYRDAMTSVGEWCIDERGTPIVDPRKKKRFLDANNNVASSSAAAAGGGGGIGGSSSSSVAVVGGGVTNVVVVGAEAAALGGGRHRGDQQAHRRGGGASAVLDYWQGEKLADRMKSEIVFMEKLGDSIMNELETAEDEVCKAWEIYYRKMLDYSRSSSGAVEDRLEAAQDVEVKGCADVWVEEMRYRMAVAFLSSVWEKCSSELSKLFLSMKDAECKRRTQIKELLIKTARTQEGLWLGVPPLIGPILTELTEWRMEKKTVEEDVQHSIRERAQSIQLKEVERKKSTADAKSNAPGLDGVDAGDGNFELSSPLVSDLLSKAKVVEKRGQGMISSWKLALAIVTVDSFLHLFELPQACKLHSGSAPEVAFQNLIPPVVVPSIEGMKEGTKPPSAKHWFDHLVPSESFALPNCTVSLMDEKRNPSSFEIVETFLTSGASKVFTKVGHRKMQIRTNSREEARGFVDELKKLK
ncbi:hypothetical protein ACHAW5_011320 [Stephanodiscus triporus]|uniref:Uncharacterized protein n=1 Tax=Stephanodiscus triporus TaxID=2934178 RepID=A0ABD3NIZ6_9STRA